MSLYEDLIQKKETLAVTGLGYVGLVLALGFSKKIKVIGFDINETKINQYLNGIDKTNEVGSEALNQATLLFTADETSLQTATFHIIAVPTPVHSDNTPDLSPLIHASNTVGKYLKPGSIVVYESTVFPGVTEEVCVPLLEKASGFTCGKDFKVGYSPERVNPGDKVHTVEKIVKIVSGIDEETLDTISRVYELVIEAGVYRAPSIKVAEAAKVIENAQRDINIAFMNELSIIFEHLNLDTLEVLKAASTKWNFLSFYPGLVGGHCIGVDPYYLTYRASQLGYTSKIILAGRSLNDQMGSYVAEKVVRLLIEGNRLVKGARVGILGITFKENCPDTRNSKVVDLLTTLLSYGINLFIVDPVADPEEVASHYPFTLTSYHELQSLDALVIAVAHDCFKAHSLEDFLTLFKKEKDKDYPPLIADIKGIYDKKLAHQLGYLYWRL
ncbi:UDP-N-acetyl-D-galactosamine dehydrogenase [Sporanaerobium hydrogeniformans]|uniref:UDP-N-acetyl-D-galactosamine dehydrogenase n=1 Tax=Sporanaerobium hydrogeniformans TaxID=3072179 RepID=A0AC61DD16_9FIRM|nr:UDP-N-acetyl-D-galactosamine dehydrogenase [Sporanaerobium hydrogeniformans]